MLLTSKCFIVYFIAYVLQQSSENIQIVYYNITDYFQTKIK
jgi:hypothetical protein